MRTMRAATPAPREWPVCVRERVRVCLCVCVCVVQSIPPQPRVHELCYQNEEYIRASTAFRKSATPPTH